MSVLWHKTIERRSHYFRALVVHIVSCFFEWFFVSVCRVCVAFRRQWSVRPLTMEHVSYVLFNILHEMHSVFVCHLLLSQTYRRFYYCYFCMCSIESNLLVTIIDHCIVCIVQYAVIAIPRNECAENEREIENGSIQCDARLDFCVISFFFNFSLNWSVASTAIYTQLDAITLHCAAAVACCILENDKIESHKQMSLPNGKTRMSSRAWIFSIQRQKCTFRVFEFGVNVNVIVSVIVVAFDCVNCAVNFMESLTTSYVNASHIHTLAMWRRRRRRQRDAFEWMAVVVH